MRKLIIIFLCGLLLISSCSSKSVRSNTIENPDVISMVIELQNKRNKTIQNFEFGKTVHYKEASYSVYTFTSDLTVYKSDGTKEIEKNKNYIGVSEIIKDSMNNLKIVNSTERFFGNYLKGIVFTGIYDKKYNVYVIGGKIIDKRYIDSNVEIIAAKLTNEKTITAKVDEKGYFLLIYKSIVENPRYGKKYNQGFFEEITCIEGMDSEGRIEQKITLGFH